MSPLSAPTRGLVSVIIPTHDRRELVLRALRSVYGQTYRPHEIIVVDDGSTDNTASAVQVEFPGVTVLERVQGGVSAARNTGIAHATGEWLAFLDSDDEWCPRKLELQFEAVSRDPESRICHTDEIWIRKGRRVNPKDKHSKSGGWIYQRCLPLCAISPSSVMIHRSVFEDVGTFEESLPACEDYDLWLRICNRYPVLYLEDKLVVKYGGHEDQLSRKYWGMDRFRIQALERMLESNELVGENKQATLAMLKHKIGVYVGGAIRRGKCDEETLYRQKLTKWETCEAAVVDD